MISCLGKLTQQKKKNYRYWGIIYDYKSPVNEQFDPARGWKMSFHKKWVIFRVKVLIYQRVHLITNYEHSLPYNSGYDRN